MRHRPPTPRHFHLSDQEDPMAKGANPPKKETKKPKKDTKTKEPKK